MPKTKRSAEELKDSRLECYLSSSLEDEPPLKPKSQWLSGKLKKESAKDKKSTTSRNKLPAVDVMLEDEEEEAEVAEKPALDDGNMQTIMSLLGMDYEKSVLAKKKKLDHYTDGNYKI